MYKLVRYFIDMIRPLQVFLQSSVSLQFWEITRCSHQGNHRVFKTWKSKGCPKRKTLRMRENSQVIDNSKLPQNPIIFNWFKISFIQEAFVFNIIVEIHIKMVPKWSKWVTLLHGTLVTIPKHVTKT